MFLIASTRFPYSILLPNHQGEVAQDAVRNDNADHDADQLAVAEGQAIIVRFNNRCALNLAFGLESTRVHAMVAPARLACTFVYSIFELTEDQALRDPRLIIDVMEDICSTLAYIPYPAVEVGSCLHFQNTLSVPGGTRNPPTHIQRPLAKAVTASATTKIGMSDVTKTTRPSAAKRSRYR